MARSSAGNGRGGRGGRGGPGISEESRNDDVNTYEMPHVALEDLDLPLVNESDSDEEIEDSDQIGGSVRGSNIPTPLPTSSARQLIWMNGNEFSDQKSCSREITNIVKLLFHGEWGCWDDVPATDRKEMWGHFQNVFQWSSESHSQIESRWNQQMKKRFRDLLRRAREQAFKKATKEGHEVREDDYSCIATHNPSWLKQEFWRPLVSRWNTDEWKKISKQNKENRKKLIGGPHTCGSASYTTTRTNWEVKLGRPVSSHEFFMYGHTKKGSRPWERVSEDVGSGSGAASGSEAGSSHAEELIWVNERSRIHLETYDRLMIERFGEDLDNHPPHCHELWEIACGGRKKGRLLGASDADDPVFVLTGTPGTQATSNSTCPHPAEKEVEKLQKTVMDMEEELAESKKEIAERKKESAERKKEIEALEEAGERRDRELNDYRNETDRKLAMILERYTPPPPPPSL